MVNAFKAFNPLGSSFEVVLCNVFASFWVNAPSVMGLVIDDNNVLGIGHIAEDFANVGLVT
jgi:hypothetical protein